MDLQGVIADLTRAEAAEAYRSADLLVRARTGFASPVCVVTFDSFTDRRTLDREGFGEAFLASRGINAVHVLSRDNDWYLLSDIEAALAAAWMAAAPFERVIAYGSSMGGYAAIRLGGLVGATAALALSPQFSIDPSVVAFENRWAPDARRLDYAIERKLQEKGFVPSATVVYDPEDRDGRHVELYRGLLDLREVRLPDCGHPVTGFLAEIGLLQRAVLDAAAGTFDPAAFEADALAMRERAPQYFRTLARRPGPPEAKLPLVRRAYELRPDDVGYIVQYARALEAAGRDAEAVAMFDEAMRREPDHLTVLQAVCAFLVAKRQLPAARAIAEWLSRLHPDAAPVEALRIQVGRRRLFETADRLRRLPARLRGEAPQALAPRAERLESAQEAGSAPRPRSPTAVSAWKRHAAAIEALPASRVDALLVGDGLAEAWPSDLRLGGRIANLGSAGDDARRLLWRLMCLEEVDAKAAVVMVGAEDLLAGEAVTTIADGIGAAVGEIRIAAPAAAIALVSIPPLGPDGGFRDADRLALNAALAALPGVRRVEAPHGPKTAHSQPDGLRLTRAGYERLAEAVARALGPV